jgi:hypothetical protein
MYIYLYYKGKSFEINLKNNIVIIAGGTGILPFMDLLDFILRKTIYELL